MTAWGPLSRIRVPRVLRPSRVAGGARPRGSGPAGRPEHGHGPGWASAGGRRGAYPGGQPPAGASGAVRGRSGAGVQGPRWGVAGSGSGPGSVVAARARGEGGRGQGGRHGPGGGPARSPVSRGVSAEAYPPAARRSDSWDGRFRYYLSFWAEMGGPWGSVGGVSGGNWCGEILGVIKGMRRVGSRGWAEMETIRLGLSGRKGGRGLPEVGRDLPGRGSRGRWPCGASMVVDGTGLGP